jgi:hypothetical protein
MGRDLASQISDPLQGQVRFTYNSAVALIPVVNGTPGGSFVLTTCISSRPFGLVMAFVNL